MLYLAYFNVLWAVAPNLIVVLLIFKLKIAHYYTFLLVLLVALFIA